MTSPLVAAVAGCQPQPCDVSESAADCQAFDPEHWRMVGAPAPAVATSGGLDPNRCDSCYVLGDCAPCGDALLLSQTTLAYRPGLQVGAQLHQAAGLAVRAGLTLTWQTSFAGSVPCTGDAPVDRVAAVELTRDASGGSVVTCFVDDVAVATLSWPSETVAAFVRVDAEGFARFYLRPSLSEVPSAGAPADYRSDRALPQSEAPIRMAIYGGGSGVRISEIGAWDTARCHDPVPNPGHADPVSFPDGVALSTGVTGLWNDYMVESPSVVRFAGKDHMFFTGRKGGADAPAKIGRAVLQNDGTHAEWVLSSQTSLLSAVDLYPDLPQDTELYGPAAVVLPDGRLALYYTVAARNGDTVLWTAIDGAVSADGTSFSLLRPDGPLLLTPVDAEEVPETWERGVRDPSVVWRPVAEGNHYTMLYTARSDPQNPFTAQIGLAESTDGIVWQRGNIVADCPLSGCNQPVVAPPADALVHTAVSDPTVLWDPLLELYRLWYVWRVGQQFSIFHAAAVDARHWVLYPGNPVLRSGDLPWCDDKYLDGPSALLDDSGRLRFWYHGHGLGDDRPDGLTDRHSICYAENAILQ